MSSFKSSVIPSKERKVLSLWGKVKTASSTPIPSAAHFEARRAWAPEAHFMQSLRLQQKRAKRSGQPFLLMLLEGTQVFGAGGRSRLLAVTAALLGATRETDLCGWYRQNHTLGVVFTDVNLAEIGPTVEVLKVKVEAALRARLTPTDVKRVKVSFHLFPETGDGDGERTSQDSGLYPNPRKRGGAQTPWAVLSGKAAY